MIILSENETTLILVAIRTIYNAVNTFL